MRQFMLLFVSTAWTLMLSVQPAAAQFIGTFTWQSQPYCNRITVNVTQAGNAYILEGFDNQCGAARRAPLAGTAALNPDGSVGLGLAIVNTPGGEPTHIDAVVNLQTLGGTWSDSGGNAGTFVFNGEGGGVQRPTNQVAITGFGAMPFLIGRRANGTATAPETVGSLQTLLRLEGRGYDGSAFVDPSPARISMYTTESWSPSAHGTAISFLTTNNGSAVAQTRMLIDHDGRVGIGTLTPAQRLDVAGNVRIGTGALGCVEDRDGDVIAGVCASDARFKRDVASFEPMLSKVAALRPVEFYWRADEFPARAFGSQQSYGLMAQEVEAVLPELVTTDADGYKAVNYSKLPLLAIQAIKDLKAENDTIKADNRELARRLARIEAYLRLP
jgi:hypothetical protein